MTSEVDQTAMKTTLEIDSKHVRSSEHAREIRERVIALALDLMAIGSGASGRDWDMSDPRDAELARRTKLRADEATDDLSRLTLQLLTVDMGRDLGGGRR